jgi:hypothetical protein
MIWQFFGKMAGCIGTKVFLSQPLTSHSEDQAQATGYQHNPWPKAIIITPVLCLACVLAAVTLPACSCIGSSAFYHPPWL